MRFAEPLETHADNDQYCPALYYYFIEFMPSGNTDG